MKKTNPFKKFVELTMSECVVSGFKLTIPVGQFLARYITYSLNDLEIGLNQEVYVKSKEHKSLGLWFAYLQKDLKRTLRYTKTFPVKDGFCSIRRYYGDVCVDAYPDCEMQVGYEADLVPFSPVYVSLAPYTEIRVKPETPVDKVILTYYYLDLKMVEELQKKSDKKTIIFGKFGYERGVCSRLYFK